MGPFPAGGGVDAAGLGLFSPFYSLVPPSGELMGAAAAFVQLQKEMQLLSLRDLCPPPQRRVAATVVRSFPLSPPARSRFSTSSTSRALAAPPIKSTLSQRRLREPTHLATAPCVARRRAAGWGTFHSISALSLEKPARASEAAPIYRFGVDRIGL